MIPEPAANFDAVWCCHCTGCYVTLNKSLLVVSCLRHLMDTLSPGMTGGPRGGDPLWQHHGAGRFRHFAGLIQPTSGLPLRESGLHELAAAPHDGQLCEGGARGRSGRSWTEDHPC
jgi:hypothetical protein